MLTVEQIKADIEAAGYVLYAFLGTGNQKTTYIKTHKGKIWVAEVWEWIDNTFGVNHYPYGESEGGKRSFMIFPRTEAEWRDFKNDEWDEWKESVLKT